MHEVFNSSQEEFWAGEFGQQYISRNDNSTLLAANVSMFTTILSNAHEMPSTFLELGANVGMNIRAIQKLAPHAEFAGIEINKSACELLARTGCKVFESSIYNANLEDTYDFVYSKGVLIHISPEQLTSTYEKLYKWSNKYILIAEYYNPTPVELVYRGNTGKLFKRDFAGEIMNLYPDLVLRDYGFIYHRGQFPQDDITWFLFEKYSGQ